MDLPAQLQEGGVQHPEVASAASQTGDDNAQVIISDSGSSTEVEEDDDDDPGGGEPAAPRLPSTWAFSQRVVHRTTDASSTAQGATTRRRRRQGLRVHYPSQTSAPFRGFADFLLRAPAANTADPDSSSTTEVSESEEDEVERDEGRRNPAERDGGRISAEGRGPRTSAESDGGQPPAEPDQEQAGPQESSTNSSSAADIQAPEAQHTTVQPPPGQVDPHHSEEGEGDVCTICFEGWTTSGEHRLAALRCGHLFGHTCILRWLKAQGTAAKCPQCNKKAKRSDIVLLYAPRVRALDNTEQENLKKTLEHEQSLRRRAELESAQCKLRLQAVTSQFGATQQELQELKALMAQTGRTPVALTSSSTPLLSQSQKVNSSRTAQYSFSKAVLVSQTGGCRVLTYSESEACLLVSQPSAHAPLLPGCGVKKVSALTMKASTYVPIHSKQIRGLAFGQRSNRLLLSASLDSTVKITCLQTNTVVQAYNTGKPVWSCCWSLDSNIYFYAGLCNGSVLIYDTRNTNEHVQELQPLRSRCPVASLCYVPRAASSSFPCGGLIAGSLDGGRFWEQIDEATYKPHTLPLETASCTDIQVEPESRHCLVTYRPGRSNPLQRCVLMALTRGPLQDSGLQPACSCYPVQTFTAGSSCKLLTKNAVFKSPDGDCTLVCAGDEASNSTMVWDASTGSLLQKLPADLPVLDIRPYSLNGEHFLAALTEKMLKLYKWE